MPVTSSAKKALRKDRRKQIINKSIRSKVANSLKSAREELKPESLPATYSIIDRAAKKNIIHKNKASRLKSRITKVRKKTG